PRALSPRALRPPPRPDEVKALPPAPEARWLSGWDCARFPRPAPSNRGPRKPSSPRNPWASDRPPFHTKLEYPASPPNPKPSSRPEPPKPDEQNDAPSSPARIVSWFPPVRFV